MGAGAGERVLGGVAARAGELLGVDLGEEGSEHELRSLAPRHGVLGDLLGEVSFLVSCLLCFTPATHSTSRVLKRFSTTFAFIWKLPEARPS